MLGSLVADRDVLPADSSMDVRFEDFMAEVDRLLGRNRPDRSAQGPPDASGGPWSSCGHLLTDDRRFPRWTAGAPVGPLPR